MRWLSSFAILVYLSLLCAPQTFAAHDSRFSRLADTQLQGLNPAISSALHQKDLIPEDTSDDEPLVVLPLNNNISFEAVASTLALTPALAITPAVSRAHPARAPPSSISL
jgi:hypothetical protein